MALYGLVPVPEIQFSDFIFPAYDQIVSELAKYRYRSGGEYAAKLVIRTPGRRRHPRRPLPLAVARIALHPRRRAEGRLPVQPVRRQGAAPRVDPRSRPGPLLRAQAHLPRGEGEVPEGDYTVEIGKARIAREGKDVTIIAWGAMLYEAIAAADQAKEKGIECEIIDLRTLWPVDIDTSSRA